LTEDEIRAKRIWKEACDSLHVPFVKKGTKEYDRVLKVFKKLIAPPQPGPAEQQS
jgi:hypothetical protein